MTNIDKQTDKPVETEILDGVACITLNRPAAFNALNRALSNGLIEAFEKVSADDATKAVVLTGAGKAFCAGVDLKALTGDPDFIKVGGLGPDTPVVRAIRKCKKPIIGAINGAAVTGGFELALACDFLYAADTAKFADTHARVGIMPGWGLSQKLSRLVGINRAREISFTGNYFSAAQAEQWGLVNRVLAPEELLPAALETARQIADTIPEALYGIKALMNDGWELVLGEALELEGERSQVFAETVDYSAMEQRLQTLRTRAKK